MTETELKQLGAGAYETAMDCCDDSLSASQVALILEDAAITLSNRVGAATDGNPDAIAVALGAFYALCVKTPTLYPDIKFNPEHM